MAIPPAGVMSNGRKFDEELTTSSPNARERPPHRLGFGPFVADLETGRLTEGERVIPLAPKPFETLCYLAERSGRVISKTELVQRLWPDSFVTEDVLVQCIMEIRRALGDPAKSPHYVQTFPRRGYQFMAPVQVLNGTETAPAAPGPAPSRGRKAFLVAGTLLFGAAAVAAWLTGRPARLASELQAPGEHDSPQSGSLPVLPITVGAHQAEAATVGYYALASLGSVGSAERRATELFTTETGIRVSYRPGLEESNQRLELYTGLFEKHAEFPDVYLIDVVWPGLLAEHLVDLRPELGATAAEFFPAIVKNNTVDGRLVGIPAFADVGSLFYRTDLLKKYGYARPPGTWDELEEMAARIQAGERAAGDKGFWGFVWQGAAAEGLTCNGLEWQMSHGGGKIIEDDGTISVNNPAAVRALERAARWVGSISPPGVLVYREDDARNIWQAGRVAFMRNWPYCYLPGQAADSPIRNRFAVSSLPSGGAMHAHAFGGWQLAVSKYSLHRREAIDLVRYLAGSKVQKSRLLEGSQLPTIAALYDDPEVKAAVPYSGVYKPILMEQAVARPSTITGVKYKAVSESYYTAVHEALAGHTTAAQALANLEQQLVRLTGFKTGPPAPVGAQVPASVGAPLDRKPDEKPH
jgi:trehalose/maltose transport system substrate-binding protein